MLFGVAWIFLSLALTLHVIDEALTDFLSVWQCRSAIKFSTLAASVANSVTSASVPRKRYG